MSLILTYRWEHALVATVVAKAKEKCADCVLGRTALQKLLYFLSVDGVPMRYDFEIYNYGPYCDDIGTDVDWLMADQVIEDRSSDSRVSNYQRGPHYAELRKQFEKPLAEHAAKIQKVVDTLSDLSANTLELIGTLTFCFRWVRAGGGGGPWKAKAVEKFKKIKKEKFTDQEIDKRYAELVKANLIEN